MWSGHQRHLSERLYQRNVYGDTERWSFGFTASETRELSMIR
jgi:hypothetical protein